MSQTTAALACGVFEQIWNGRDDSAIDKLAHADGISHQCGGDVKSAAEFRERIYKPFLDAMPDLHITIEDVLADGDQAVVRWLARGTHLGGGFGMPPSGRRAEFRGMTWLVFRDGKISEGWDCWDQGALMQRLAAPPSTSSP